MGAKKAETAENQEKTAKNIIKIEEVGPCKKKVTIEIPEETIQKVTDEQYEILRKDTPVPGFRKGRAPRRLLEKKFGKEAGEQIKLKLMADASEQALKDNNIKMLRDPDIGHEKISMPESGALKFDFEVEVRPEFELPELEGIEVEKTKLEVEAGQVDKELEQLRKYSGLWTSKEAGAEEGDQIIADVKLKIEGVEEDEKLDNISTYVRKNGFVGSIPVENLDEVLAGVVSGDKKQTSVEVAKTYFKEEYRGKKVDISIDVKEVKYLKPAEITSDFLKRFGVDSEEDLRELLRDNLEKRLEQMSREEMSEQIYKYMLDKVDFELPTSIVADQSNTLLQRQFTSLLNRGLGENELKEELEKLRAGSDEQAKNQLKTFFIMDKVAEKLGIEISDEEVNGRIAQIAIQQGHRPEQMREQMVRNGSLAEFSLQVREEKTIAALLEKAKIKEVESKKEKKTAKKTAKKSGETEEKAAAEDEKPAKKAKKTTKKETKD